MNSAPMHNFAIVSLQSDVAFGYVGNAVARPALQALGREVWPLASLRLSNHKGYGAWHAMGPALDVEAALASLNSHLDWRNTALLSGYLAEAEQGAALARHLQAKPPGFYLLDPVLGDEEPGLYVDPALVPVYRDGLLPRADAVCLNYFEFCTLTGCASLEGFAGALEAWGPAQVLVTSVPSAQGLAIWGKDAGALWRVTTPKLAAGLGANGARLPMPNGLGDLVSALWLDSLLRGQTMAEALASLADRVFALLEASLAAGRRELALIARRDLLLEAPARFRAERV